MYLPDSKKPWWRKGENQAGHDSARDANTQSP
jgi:hypothetical protein